ncbi:tRNA (adenosine(37)-N6)-threonylcarbamoyltransferase complex dimerization subunit type 1 TsaB [Providencia huaxiensis]|uniref:tRNA threonylcarbamoyladenosine biosynthesis protein TsaB n=1 Tax=Providencia huaxiensis TaxID=2027290 RepID=A0A8I2D9G2_9GAMM|nr:MULTISPECIES: tRNA (adenosine(37)-N6)-threonylcarbamoyltransferase complex dimerization subunit type 1 TsaB [Providencia]MBQ0267562.1 tRNA (adenosine(37)-N6)-threonylcarbamoyltransferase complex dimerization subunit type 1 TsaB [Providencia huaxiensis]MCD2530227.1 tRNA (adenosine(37)-N6)-threonylcarbamoyltransferase complex dimerization subunit type 1 TsaB [Providencia huaxiensis]MCG9536186.1 tRNA (adenosine(37)-N6)-threonylcarbamoyltransferase complex dimerization subunit type 1 TsaB [Provid
MSSRILAVDTATEACSVALWCDGDIISRFAISPREHTQKILPMVEDVLAEAGMGLSQLDALAFGRGPGSFTGVRIGVGIAQGLALGANLPMIGISSLMTLAEGAFRIEGHEQVLVAIDARMSEIYCAQYQRTAEGRWLGEDTEAVLLPDDFESKFAKLSGRWGYAGTGWEAYPSLLNASATLANSHITLPDAQDMLPIAAQLWQQGKVVAVENVEPTYLRNEVTWKKLPGRE